MNNLVILLVSVTIGSSLGILGAYCYCKLLHSDIWNRKKTPDRDHIQRVKDQKCQFEELLEDLKIHNPDDKTGSNIDED